MGFREDTTSELGELVHDRRVANGMSQEELAETMGISVRSLQKLELGGRCEGRILKRVASWFEITMEDAADMMDIRVERTW